MSVEDIDVTVENGEQSEEEGQEEEEEQTEEISGWADSMLNILKSTKPKNKKNLILSRARKDYEVLKNPTPQKGNDIEIAREERSNVKKEGDVDDKDVKKDGDNILSLKQQRKLELRQRKLGRAWENLNRITSQKPDKELETDLVKIATKGVVQLFNAVAQQQKIVKTKLRASSKSEFKKDKVLSHSKDIFDDAMSKTKIVGKHEDEVQIKEESSSEDEIRNSDKPRKRKLEGGVHGGNSSKKPVWQALQDDFMLGAKLKDWDKDSDSD